jgi:non-heme chloroperoxidase
MDLKPSAPMAPSFVTLATGLRLEYVEHGPADGIPVVFLHGVTDSWRSFEPVLHFLPPTTRAFAISQRGHGDSGCPDSGYTYRDLSEDLRAFLDALALPRVIVVGHSMGSMVAQRFVVDHPERVAGLVLIGAFATLYRDPGLSDFVVASIDTLADPIPTAFAREWQLSTVARPIEPQFLETVVRETCRPPARVWRAAFHAFLSTPDFSSELASVSVHTLLVWGDRDSYAPRAHQDALLGALPHAHLSVYDGAGHALHWEDPAAFAAEISAFVDRTEKSA